MSGLHTYPPEDLARLLHWPEKYDSMPAKPKYHTFHLRKREGGWRLIQAPGKSLRRVQKSIAQMLMPPYMNVIPDCVHGYVPGDYPGVGVRHILSNARAHIDAAYLLNIDIDGFFDAIDTMKLMAALREFLPDIHQRTLEYIVLVSTHENKLPMGAPSSPVLSNIVCLALDNTMTELANTLQMTYTRYVDDMSFGASQPLEGGPEEQIEHVVDRCGFSLNPEKRRHYDADAAKAVTGLIIDAGNIHVEQRIISNIKRCIREYEQLSAVADHLKSVAPELKYKMRHIRRSIKGQIAFMAQITGEDHPDTKKLKKAYKKSSRANKPVFDFYI